LTPGANKGDRDRGDWVRAVREAAPFLGIGTTLAGSVLLGLGAGYWLDGKLRTTPVFFLVGGALGMGAAFSYVYKLLRTKKP